MEVTAYDKCCLPLKLWQNCCVFFMLPKSKWGIFPPSLHKCVLNSSAFLILTYGLFYSWGWHLERHNLMMRWIHGRLLPFSPSLSGKLQHWVFFTVQCRLPGQTNWRKSSTILLPLISFQQDQSNYHLPCAGHWWGQTLSPMFSFELLTARKRHWGARVCLQKGKELGKGLEYKSHEEQLWKLRFLNMEKRRLRGTL